MAQISLYIDDNVASRLNSAAKSQNLSVSKYVANIISESLSNSDAKEAQKKQLLRELQGALDDSSYTEQNDILLVAESSRRYDLI